MFVISRSGKVLGYGHGMILVIHAYTNIFTADYKLNDICNDKVLQLKETLYNVQDILKDLDINMGIGSRLFAIVPVFCGGNRLGTILFERGNKVFTEDDIVLAEYGATIVGMEILRAESEEIEEEARKLSNVRMAVSTLSYSELEAIVYILEELDGTEGLLVASKVADRIGITRSVIVNALRKLESAGVIESRSLGMKGTYIKILNDKLFNEIKK